MPDTTTLLVTRSASMIDMLRDMHDDKGFTRLEVCGRLDRALPRLGRGRDLVLIDADADPDGRHVRQFLDVADRTQCRTGVLTTGDPDPGRPAAFAPYPTYHLPRDLPTLGTVLDELRADAARAPGRAAPADPAALDPLTASLLGGDLGEQFARIRRVAGQTTTVLLTGETGSGKSMLARYIHALSPVREHPYLVVDCGALSGHLIESEMFGHVRGAFTGADRDRQGKFAAAGIGTLVLDEINSLPLPLQAKLLRAVEDRVFEPVGSNRSEPLRARLIAVSNAPLADEIRRERFRADLYYRLNVVEFDIPPLRDRIGAVIPLAHQFLRASATASCHDVTAISTGAVELMITYQWPGNVRELRNVIERAAALASGPVIGVDDLPESIRGRAPVRSGYTPPPLPMTLTTRVPVEAGEACGDEASRILSVLRKHNNNRLRAARELGMSRMSLYKKLHKYGLFIRKGRFRAAVV